MSYEVFSHYGILASTPKAVLVALSPPVGGRKDDAVWVPRSVLEDPEEPDAGDPPGELSIKSWFLEKQGLV